MLNIQNIGIKPYQFADGDNIINTKYPTQKFWEEFNHLDASDPDLGVFDRMLDMILYEADKHYIAELDLVVKLAIIQDYFKYHTENLGARFPDTYITKQ